MKTGISSRLGVVQLYGRHSELQTLAPQSRINAEVHPESTRRQNREQSQLMVQKYRKWWFFGEETRRA
jgi:hypothetical protein